MGGHTLYSGQQGALKLSEQCLNDPTTTILFLNESNSPKPILLQQIILVFLISRVPKHSKLLPWERWISEREFEMKLRTWVGSPMLWNCLVNCLFMQKYKVCIFFDRCVKICQKHFIRQVYITVLSGCLENPLILKNALRKHWWQFTPQSWWIKIQF